MTKNSYSILLMEDTPREQAHKMGLIGVGGYWYSKSDLVNGKVKQGSSPRYRTKKGQLVPMSTAAAPPKASFSPTTATKPKPSATRRSLAIAPIDIGSDEEFRTKSEVSQKIISTISQPILLDGKMQKVRLPIDRKGNPINIKNLKNRKVVAKAIAAAIQRSKSKILRAAKIAKGSTLAKKWLADIGELYTLGQLLEQGAEAYLLPDSEPKNDIVVSFAGKHRDMALLYLSVKATYANEEINGLGANALSDLQKAVGTKTIMLTPKIKVSAANYLEEVFAIKRNLIKSITEGRVGRKGIYLAPGEEKALLTKPELIDGKPGFASQYVYIQARRITAKDIQNLSNYTAPVNKEIYEQMKVHILERLKVNPKLTLDDLSEFLVDEVANVLAKTKTLLKPVSDQLAFRFSADAGIDSVKVAMAEDVFTKQKQKVIKSGIPQTHGIPLNPRDQLKFFLGLDQRTRALGKKDENKGYVDPIINSTPTVSTLDIERDIPSYLKILQSRK